MRDARSIVAVFALLAGLIMMTPGRANGQAVAFQPTPAPLLDGATLSATPVVSADRRYVRLGVAPMFQTIDGFQTFPVPGAIAGGGNGGGLGGGGLGGLGAGGLGGAGGGFRSVMGGPADFATWYPGLGVPQNYVARAPEMLPAKPLKSQPTRSKKPLPDPVIVPIKKKSETKPAAARVDRSWRSRWRSSERRDEANSGRSIRCSATGSPMRRRRWEPSEFAGAWNRSWAANSSRSRWSGNSEGREAVVATRKSP